MGTLIYLTLMSNVYYTIVQDTLKSQHSPANVFTKRLDTFLAQRYIVIATVIATASTPFVNLG